MRYLHSKELSLEYLRLAVPLMSKQLAAAHPISYAVWYEYVAGMNAALKQELDNEQQAGHLLDDAKTLGLFRKHVADVDQATLDRLQHELHRLLSEVAVSAQDSQQQTSNYAVTLTEFSVALSQRYGQEDDTPLKRTLQLVERHTDQIKRSILRLEQSLEQSRSEVEQLRHELERMREELKIDALSGLLNRKAFDQTTVDLIRRANEEKSGLCLVLIDIDRFKTINDSYGHLFGDRVIRAVAQVLNANTQGRDVAARYGGEEFALLLPQTPLTGAQQLSEQIRATIERASIRRQDSDQTVGHITVSAGISQYSFDEDADAFIRRADQALYRSKNRGRNCVTVAGADG